MNNLIFFTRTFLTNKIIYIFVLRTQINKQFLLSVPFYSRNYSSALYQGIKITGTQTQNEKFIVFIV